MSLAATCPHCAQRVGVPDTSAGRPVRCPRCRQPFTASAPAPVPVCIVPRTDPRPRVPGMAFTAAVLALLLGFACGRWTAPAAVSPARGEMLAEQATATVLPEPKGAEQPAAIATGDWGTAASFADMSDKAEAVPPATPARKPEPGPSEAYRVRMKVVLTEARALADLLATVPKMALYQAKEGELDAALDRLQDPPAGLAFKTAHRSALEFRKTFRRSEKLLGLIHDSRGDATVQPSILEDAAEELRNTASLAKESVELIAAWLVIDLQPAPSAKATPSAGSSSSGPVSVKGYTRKDGTTVAPYTRKAPSGGRRR